LFVLIADVDTFNKIVKQAKDVHRLVSKSVA